MANFIKGRVFDERSRRPVPGLTIDAFTDRTHERLGTAQTNADGVFGGGRGQEAVGGDFSKCLVERGGGHGPCGRTTISAGRRRDGGDRRGGFTEDAKGVAGPYGVHD